MCNYVLLCVCLCVCWCVLVCVHVLLCVCLCVFYIRSVSITKQGIRAPIFCVVKLM
jgi:hypothetical protein